MCIKAVSPHRQLNLKLFSIFSVEDKDIFEMFVNNKQGGFSQVMHRRVEVGKPMRYGVVCRGIMGLDCGALYLYSMGHTLMPQGQYKVNRIYLKEEILRGHSKEMTPELQKFIGETVEHFLLQLKKGWFGFVECDCEIPPDKLQIWKAMNFLPMFQSKIIHPILQ